jgi:lysyl-tRNA synthetase class II
MDDTNSLIEQRKAKLAALRAKGIDPFQNKFIPTESCDAARKNYVEGREVALAGRITAHRDMGKSMFIDIRDQSGRIQCYAQKNVLGDEQWNIFTHLDLGDFIGVRGTLFTTKTGEISVKIGGVAAAPSQPSGDGASPLPPFVILAKALRPPPAKYYGLEDTEIRYRQRYLDLIANPDVKDVMLKRSAIIHQIRNFFHERGYVEVETPAMQAIPGGAAAQPFKTFHNALGCEFYLRIALELYHKRLLVGGIDKLFEIGKNFRNEGLSRRHNPEFTMLEAYCAFGDYATMMETVESLITTVAQKVLGTLKIEHDQSSSVQSAITHTIFEIDAKSHELSQAITGSVSLNVPAHMMESEIQKLRSNLAECLKQIGTIPSHEIASKALAEVRNVSAELRELFIFSDVTLSSLSVRKIIDLTPKWRQVKYKDLIRQMVKKDWFEISANERLAHAVDLGVDFAGAQINELKKLASLRLQDLSKSDKDKIWVQMSDMISSFDDLPEDFEVTGAVFEKLIEPTLIQPTFVTHLPKELVPLAKLSPDDPTTVEVFECCINGQEISPGYTEQNDPIAQRTTLEHQAGGEQQKLDEDFLVALEHGMPPAGGIGIGIDRLCMMLLGQESIRDVILFPQLKPK